MSGVPEDAFGRLHPALRHHIVNSLGWRSLRPVQELAIDGCLEGANLVVLAPTAGGKTEAALFPLLSQMLGEDWRGLSVLYLSPIRALLNNQADRVDGLLRLVGRRSALRHGDTPAGERRRTLADPPDCLLTTPESLEVLLTSPKVDHARLFENVRAVVIDELHAFAGDDRGWHLLSVLARIERLAGRDLQRIGLSATVGNPAEMLDWLSAGSGRTRRVIRPADPNLAEPDVQLDYVGSLANAARVVAALHRGEKRLVFCDSRVQVERLAVGLRSAGVDTFVSHSSLSADERRRAEAAFAGGRNCVIVATSALELGLDVGDLDRVIQIDAPGTVSSFLQRMGRTGRRTGAVPNCLFLATDDDALLRAATLIDLRRTGYVEPVRAPPRPYHVLAQQLMALVLQERGVGRSRWFGWVESVPGFADLPPDRAVELVDHMLAEGLLWDDDGILGFAPGGEEAFGRRNFLELLSVFTTPPLFNVVHGRTELGQVHESTFYKTDERPTAILLAGRVWAVRGVDWRRRVAQVEPARGGGTTRWVGDGRPMGSPVCHAIRRILADNSPDPAWSRRASGRMRRLRDDHPWVEEGGTVLVRTPDALDWWTFAGGVANALLAETLSAEFDVRPENLRLRFRSEAATDRVLAAVGRLDPAAVRIPPAPDGSGRLKFSECLPDRIAAEVHRFRFDDPDGVRSALAEPRRCIVEG